MAIEYDPKYGHLFATKLRGRIEIVRADPNMESGIALFVLFDDGSSRWIDANTWVPDEHPTGRS